MVVIILKARYFDRFKFGCRYFEAGLEFWVKDTQYYRARSLFDENWFFGGPGGARAAGGVWWTPPTSPLSYL